MKRPQSPPGASPAALFAWVAVVFGLPVLAVVGAVSLWRTPRWYEIVVALAMYCLGGLGISLGWHRYFTHRGFVCSSWLRRALAVAGTLAFEGSLASWVANHRVHHAHTDSEGDPHSPWTGKGAVEGFFHAHVGWLRRPGAPEDRYARDVLADPALAVISRWWWLWALLGLLVPAAATGVLAGTSAALGVVVWAGLVRVVVFHHVTWSVNSVCHMHGRRRFDTADRSTNVWWLALPSFGESWHNNHHHAPRKARHGVDRGQLDLSAMLLRLFERCGAARACRW